MLICILAAAKSSFHDISQVAFDISLVRKEHGPRRGGFAEGQATEAIAASPGAGGEASVNDDEVLQALRGVYDPEIGINIVDLGLVYRAEREPDGIAVAISLTTPSCPLGEMLIEEAREALQARFPTVPSICVELVWDPPWSPDRMSEAARRQLG